MLGNASRNKTQRKTVATEIVKRRETIELTKLEHAVLAQLVKEKVDTLEAALNLPEKEIIKMLFPLRKANFIGVNGYVTEDGKKYLQQHQSNK